jgi:hypothetical protein
MPRRRRYAGGVCTACATREARRAHRRARQRQNLRHTPPRADARPAGSATTPEGAALDAIQIPLWLPASLLAEKGNLASAIAEYLPNAPTEWLQHTLKQGRFLLVIDALDELPETQQNRFRDCAQQLDNTTGIVLVTCRTMHWEERSQWLGWKKLPDAAELAPLNLREQRAIAERFFSENPRGAQAMQQRLRESYVLRHACRTPLLLTFACLLQSENQLCSDLTYANCTRASAPYLIQGKLAQCRGTARRFGECGEERVLRQLETLVWNLFRPVARTQPVHAGCVG